MGELPPRIYRLIGKASIVLGLVILLVAGALWGWTQYNRLRAEEEQAALSEFLLLASLTPEPTGTFQVSSSTFQVSGSTLTSTPTPTGNLELGTPTDLSPFPSPTRGGEGGEVALPTPTPVPTPGSASTPGGELPMAQPIGRLVIAKLKVDVPIVEVGVVDGQWDVSKLFTWAGYLVGTGQLGEPGNAALAGHISLKDGREGAFRWLERLQLGDEVQVYADGLRYTYQVISSRVVPPTEVSVLDPTSDAVLTLITCTNWSILRGEYTDRFVVQARLVGTTSE
jgi:LPXTG-site transpeptidase (sortase) family protein